MITDHFSNLERYPQIPFLKYIQRFITEQDCLKIRNGEIEILGRDLFVRIAEYDTGPADQKQFEAHKIYADLQYIAAGREVMDVSLERNPKPVTEYDAAADIRFYEDPLEIFSLMVGAGQFTFFYPGELHKPGCLALENLSRIKKLVFKIKVPS